MLTTDQTTFDSLRARHRGRVVTAADDGWDLARQAFNLTIDQRPAAVAMPVDAEDVVAAVNFAREHGLRIAPQSTGHNAGPLGPLDGTLLLRTSEMKGVEIDAVARRARVHAGAKWEDVTPAASELGLAALHGSSPDVGVVGYTLGGGMGWYARKLGLQTNSVTAIELVTADGSLIRADHEDEPELFWALRGGGGNFGAVTAIEFDLYPVVEVYAGVLFFPWERSSEVLHAWHEWLPGTPDEVTSVGRILQFPPFPEIPEPMRGRSFVVVEAAFLGSEADGVELMRPLRALAPEIDTFAMLPPAGLSELHMDPRDPVPGMSGHALVGDLPASAIDDLVAVAGPESGSPILSVELRQTGGALARGGEHHGALDTLPGSFAMFAVGIAGEPAMDAALEAQLALVDGAMAPYDAGRYLNFTEQPADVGAAFPAATLARLQAVRADIDPDGLFHANHPVP
jgi:FAD/FMN-containing dehydrogenase